MLRCRSGKVYSLGCGHNGERGDGSDGSASTLSEVPLPDNLKASKINVGNSHALCLTDSGEVYGWGGAFLFFIPLHLFIYPLLSYPRHDAKSMLPL